VTITREDGSQVTYMVNDRTHLADGPGRGTDDHARPAVVTDDSQGRRDHHLHGDEDQGEERRTQTKSKTKTKVVGSNQ
jgi:hypothetical protein